MTAASCGVLVVRYDAKGEELLATTIAENTDVDCLDAAINIMVTDTTGRAIRVPLKNIGN